MAWGAILGGLVAGVGSYLGAKESGKGAERAAAAAERQYEQTREDLAPWRTAGAAASNEMAALYGLPIAYPVGTGGGTGAPGVVDSTASEVGEGSVSANAMAALGRGGDNAMAHVTEGETVVPQEVLQRRPGLRNALVRAFGDENMNFSRYIVGGPNSTNPDTGVPEFYSSPRPVGPYPAGRTPAATGPRNALAGRMSGRYGRSRPGVNPSRGVVRSGGNSINPHTGLREFYHAGGRTGPERDDSGLQGRAGYDYDVSDRLSDRTLGGPEGSGGESWDDIWGSWNTRNWQPTLEPLMKTNPAVASLAGAGIGFAGLFAPNPDGTYGYTPEGGMGARNFDRSWDRESRDASLWTNGMAGGTGAGGTDDAGSTGALDDDFYSSENALARYYDSPDYLLAFDEGARALEASAAARGGLFSGNTGTALTRYGQDYGGNRYDQYYNHLYGISSLGENAAVQTGNIGAETAGYAGNAYQNYGNAMAGGIYGIGNAINSGIGNFYYNDRYDDYLGGWGY